VICNDDGGGKEKVRNLGGRWFKRRSVVTDMVLLEKVRWEVTGVEKWWDKRMI